MLNSRTSILTVLHLVNYLNNVQVVSNNVSSLINRKVLNDMKKKSK